MTNRIRTDDAAAALRQLLQEKARAAADENTLVSREEAKELDPVLKRAEEAIREEGGVGTRVHVDALVERAQRDAMGVWERFNPADNGADSVWLAKAEIAEVKDADPALGALTELAALRAGKRGQDPAAVARDFFARFDFSERRLHHVSLPEGARVDARPGQPGREGVPEAVLAAFDFYYRAEDHDWGSASLHAGRVAGLEVWASYLTTDGDDAYLEVFSKAGEPLASARLHADEIVAWDEFFGRARLSPTFTSTGDVSFLEGYSEPAERAAAGQIPLEWPGDVALAKGELRYDGSQLTRVDLASDLRLTPEQREAAFATLDLLWERTLRHRAFGGEPLRLGDHEQGVLRVGEFTRPTDGQTYVVADWDDIDDASYTFYFRRTERGLELAFEQYDN